MSGIGLVGLRNKAPKIINAGDTVWIAPNDEHWHGGTKEYSIEHIGIHETMNVQVANWLEQVLDIYYNIYIFENYIIGGVINEC